MSYDEEIEKTGIREHPLTAFQNMGNLSEGEDFATEFAELLDILSKNIVIPVELIDENANVFSEYEGDTKEDILKEWAAEHAKGERVYAEIDGDMQIVDVPADPNGVSEVDVRGVGGGLDGDFETGEAIVASGNGEFVSESIDIDREPISISSGGNEVIDVSGMASTETIILESASGSSGSSGEDSFGTTDGGSEGDGVKGRIRVDLALIDNELEVIVANGTTGYNNGGIGGDAEHNLSGDGGSGGGSTALVADGEVVAEAQGGGGGGGGGGIDGANNRYAGGDGGDGGGASNGGDGASTNVDGDDGGNGNVVIYDHKMVTLVTEGTSDGGSAIIFD